MAEKNIQPNWQVSIDAPAIEAMILNIGTRSAKLKEHIGIALMSCALHGALYGDIRPLQKLDDTLGDGWYRASLRTWAVSYGPVTWKLADKEAGTKAGFVYAEDKATALKADYEANRDATVARLASKPWELEKKEPVFEGFDLIQTLKRAFSKAEKIAADPEKSKHPNNKIDAAFLAKAKAFVEREGATLQ